MGKYDVEWTKTASDDLNNIVEYIAKDCLETALNVFRKIKFKCGNLNHFPYRGRIVPELKIYGVLTYHELVIPPWRIIYKITVTKVYVLAVIDSRRNIEDVLFERFLNWDA